MNWKDPIKARLPSNDSDVQNLIDKKGVSEVIRACKVWLENREEHLRAYSPEEKEERLALRKTIQNLEAAIAEYLKS